MYDKLLRVWTPELEAIFDNAKNNLKRDLAELKSRAYPDENKPDK